jgi:predicted MFS family arabinose efflux permease
MMGAAQSLTAIGRFSGPLLFGQLYDTLGPTLTFVGAGLVMVIAWAVTLRIRDPGIP